MPSASGTSVQLSPGGGVILIAGQDYVFRLYDCEICAPITDLRKLANERLRYVAPQP